MAIELIVIIGAIITAISISRLEGKLDNPSEVIKVAYLALGLIAGLALRKLMMD